MHSVADPGFPVGGRRAVGGSQPPTQAIFSKNVCENKRIESCGGPHAGGAPWIRQWHWSHGSFKLTAHCVHASLHIFTTDYGFPHVEAQNLVSVKIVTVVRSPMADCMAWVPTKATTIHQIFDIIISSGYLVWNTVGVMPFELQKLLFLHNIFFHQLLVGIKFNVVAVILCVP